MQAIMDACDRLRDRFLWALLWDSGVRIGEALGLRHADIAAAQREITIVSRVNDNRARSKSREGRTIPVSAELIRLWGDYLHTEYGDLDSDYVFINLFAEPRGRSVLSSGLRPGQTPPETDRDRLRPPLVPTLGGDKDAARWRSDRGRLQTVGSLLGHHDVRGLRAPDRRRRPARAGAGGLVRRTRGELVTLFEITQAERAGWQRRAAVNSLRSWTPTRTCRSSHGRWPQPAASWWVT